MTGSPESRVGWPHGLRFRFNLVIIPVSVVTLTLFVWLDYRHEVQALTTIRQTADAAATDGERLGSSADDPSAIARRSLALHGLHGVLTIVLLITATNVVLTTFVLGPAERIRAGMTRMERG
jgi:hypothetical protein